MEDELNNNINRSLEKLIINLIDENQLLEKKVFKYKEENKLLEIKHKNEIRNLNNQISDLQLKLLYIKRMFKGSIVLF